MPRRAGMGGVLLALAFAGLQFTGPAHTNPETDGSLSLERSERVPADVARTLAAACSDCHSNRTTWPLYSYVAPVSWWTIHHVNRGRAELNFSIWGTYGSRTRETRLRAICELAEKGEMPLRSYVMAHPDARISADDVERLCEWTGEAAAILRSQHQ
jgi:hypothetical protein